MRALLPVERQALSARLFSEWDAAHFHIELTDVSLRGGGHIEGRVHRDGPWRSGDLRVTVRCLETWRSTPPPPRLTPPLRRDAPPFWRIDTLWEATRALDALGDRNWIAFAFAVPPGLPTAVEARSVAWRYEIEARRVLRFRPDERAVAIPLGFRSLLPGPARTLGRRELAAIEG